MRGCFGNEWSGQLARPRRQPADRNKKRVAIKSHTYVLFGAQQFLSAVHDRVTGNCSTTLLDRTNAAETAERSYRFLNPDIKAAATRLEKGQLILSHAVFREPVKIKFPMAAYKQQT